MEQAYDFTLVYSHKMTFSGRQDNRLYNDTNTTMSHPHSFFITSFFYEGLSLIHNKTIIHTYTPLKKYVYTPNFRGSPCPRSFQESKPVAFDRAWLEARYEKQIRHFSTIFQTKNVFGLLHKYVQVTGKSVFSGKSDQFRFSREKGLALGVG